MAPSRAGHSMSTDTPIPVVTVHHSGPGVAECISTLTPEQPKCSCGHVWVNFREDGTVLFDGDAEYFPLTIDSTWTIVEEEV